MTEERKCCGMTGGRKRCTVTGREKTLYCDRKELIRRSLDVFLRKRGMTLWVDSCSAIEG